MNPGQNVHSCILSTSPFPWLSGNWLMSACHFQLWRLPWSLLVLFVYIVHVLVHGGVQQLVVIAHRMNYDANHLVVIHLSMCKRAHTPHFWLSFPYEVKVYLLKWASAISLGDGIGHSILLQLEWLHTRTIIILDTSRLCRTYYPPNPNQAMNERLTFEHSFEC